MRRSGNFGLKKCVNATSRAYKAVTVGAWKTAVLGARLSVQLRRFQRDTILTAGLEGILVIFWQIIWLPLPLS